MNHQNSPRDKDGVIYENALFNPEIDRVYRSLDVSTAPSKLMVVDDEADITFTLKAVLEQSGFSLDVFNDSKTALINFKPNYYDLIILDLNMPQMNGYELYQEIKKKGDKIKVCFVTASDESLKQRFPGIEVDCLIRKPFDMNDLVNRIKKELA